MRPSVTTIVTNSNLGLTGPSVNGTAVVLVSCAAAPTAGFGTAFLVTSLEQVEAQFADEDNALVVEAFEKGFFAEASAGTKVYVLAMVNTTTIATMLAAANAEKALNLAAGEARLLAAIRFHADDYTPTIANGFDNDVDAAVTAAQTLAASWQTKSKGFRAFIQGTGFTNATAAKDYSAATTRNVAIVVGSVDDSTAAATLLALGRAAAVPPERNIGRIKSGSLNIAAADAVKIASTVAELVSSADLDTLHDKKYITFEKNAIASGYVFNDDLTLTSATDDYNNIRFGRVIDNAERSAKRAYYEELKDEVNVDDDGRLDTVVEKALQAKIMMAIARDMPGQLATDKDGFPIIETLVNPDPTEYADLYSKNEIDNPNLNIIQSETIYLFIFLRPKGCIKYINIYLGLTAA
jgi:hypothetical protein